MTPLLFLADSEVEEVARRVVHRTHGNPGALKGYLLADLLHPRVLFLLAVDGPVGRNDVRDSANHRWKRDPGFSGFLLLVEADPCVRLVAVLFGYELLVKRMRRKSSSHEE